MTIYAYIVLAFLILRVVVNGVRTEGMKLSHADLFMGSLIWITIALPLIGSTVGWW